jgi:hypothetical protein
VSEEGAGIGVELQAELANVDVFVEGSQQLIVLFSRW